jgi:NADH-ubiquinone/plastoquinone oxidoreductase subunit 6
MIATLFFILLSISFLITFLINNAFIYSKTSYLLIFSIAAFSSISSVLLSVLELEFIAITFFMMYAVGTVIVFLFLIMLVDVNLEKPKDSKPKKLNNISYFLVLALNINIIYTLLQNFDIYFRKSLGFIKAFNDLIALNFSIKMDDTFSLQHQLLTVNFADIWILSAMLFEPFFLLVILIVMYLFVAIIVSLIFCSDTFKKDLTKKS